ncbi:MAG: hypothetical protein LBJ00_15645 [Planctomycetaceae bacterium]|nr:hypothetical protein [Planctomycetaceae bacterium]
MSWSMVYGVCHKIKIQRKSYTVAYRQYRLRYNKPHPNGTPTMEAYLI